MAKSKGKEIIQWIGPDHLRPFLVPIEDLHEDPANCNLHDEESVKRIAASYARFGQQRFVVGDENRVVRAGNGQLAAARQLGWTHLAYAASNLTGTDLAAFALADNRTAEFSRRDETKVAELLQAIRSEPDYPLDATGYTAAEHDDLLERIGARIAAQEGTPVEDPMAEWQDMPECENEDKGPFRTIHVHFRTAEDVQDFSRLIGQKILDGIKYLWHPAAEVSKHGNGTYILEPEVSDLCPDEGEIQDPLHDPGA